ncbi:MAG TPA: LLM class flavin-dependent oxidoreductase, partial [Solirubrobacteraceae bacterium]
YLAARTERVRLLPDVANLPLRPPAVLAQAAASLDVLSGGRVELGLGAGGFHEAIEAFGGPARTRGESVEALGEAIEVIRLVWSDERSVSFAGEHYRLAGAHPGPPPAHDIGIWVGAYGPRMLRLTGRRADGWIPSLPRMPLDELPGRIEILDAAARAAGRDPRDVKRVANVNGRIADGDVTSWLHGPVEHWAEELARLVRELRFDGFILWPDDPDVLGQTERFATEVVPAVRAAL